jgi:hypothetical protein
MRTDAPASPRKPLATKNALLALLPGRDTGLCGELVPRFVTGGCEAQQHPRQSCFETSWGVDLLCWKGSNN